MNKKNRISELRAWGMFLILLFCVGNPLLAGSNLLNGQRWYWKEVRGHEIQSAGPYFEFGEMNRLNGFSGCNRMMGAYELNESLMSFRGIASTRMFCEGTRGEEESLILKALEEVRSWRIERNWLLLLNVGGEPLGRLQLEP